MGQDVFSLGPLEVGTLESLWDLGAADARTLHQQLAGRRGFTLSTMQSTLERLHRKGLVSRTKVSHAYVYEAASTREEVMARIVEFALKPFRSGKTQSLLAAFAEYAAGADDAELNQLEQLIAARRDDSDESGAAR